MRRPRRFNRTQPLRASGDRWLFGYADVVTLLFACVASLYATQVESSAPPTAGPPPVVAPVTIVAGDPAPAAPEASLDVELARALEQASDGFDIDVSRSPRGVVLSFPEAGSFPPGRADLTTSAREVMRRIAETVRDRTNLLRVEGHTDDVPIHTALFQSNWELSTTRATRVVQLLIDEGGIAPARLSAAGYGEHRPRVPNDSLASRARNRRVDLVVLDPGTARREEPTGAR